MTEITFKGKSYSSVKALAAAYSTRYGNVPRRLRSGWSIEQALGLADKPSQKAHNAKFLVSKSGQFSSVRKAAEAFGLKEANIHNRLSLGWSIDEALGLAVRPKYFRPGNSVICEGIEHSSISSLARHYGQNAKTVRKRLSSGWTPEQAVKIEPSPPRPVGLVLLRR